VPKRSLEANNSDAARKAEKKRPNAEANFVELSDPDPIFVQIAEQIAEAIQAGKFQIGSRLPGEMELARQFKVSRASVREALSSLQFVGYVESRRGSGTIVTSTYARGTGQLSQNELEQPEKLFDVLEARLAIEPESVRQVALKASQATINQINKLVEGMALTLEHPELNARTDLGIHLALAKACPNPFLSRMTEELVFQSEGHLWRRIRDKTWQEGKIPKSWLEHHTIIANALARGDSDVASSCMKEHLLSVVTNIASSDQAEFEDQQRAKLLIEHYSSSEYFLIRNESQ
jgi:DNA-binding FadR family transcriptional regulator